MAVHPTEADHAIDLIVDGVEDPENPVHVAIIGHGDGFADACNGLSLRVAKRLLEGSLSYEATDEVMNWVWSYINSWLGAIEGGQLPEPAYSIYDAVDAGEYHHRGDSIDVDPIAKYTIPALAAIIGPGLDHE